MTGQRGAFKSSAADDPEVERQLAAFGTTLDADRARLHRLRAQALDDFTARPWPNATRPRRVLRLALAFALVASLLTIGVAAAGQPGGPLYGLRIALEAKLLPEEGAEHTHGLLTQLDERLSELQASARAGDSTALRAAAQAYRAALRDLAEDQRTADLQDLMLSQLARHATILNTILGIAPVDAIEAVQGAIDDAEQATDVIKDRSGGTPPEIPTAQPSTAPSGEPSHPAAPSTPPRS